MRVVRRMGTLVTEFYLIDGVQPEPWEAPEGSVGRNRNGKLFVKMTTTPKQRGFQEDLKSAFNEAYPEVEMATGPVALSLYFWRDLPLAEHETRNVRSHRADATNLQKSTEDALQKILYKNDNQVVHAESWIVRQEPDTPPAILIVMTRDPYFGLDYIECTVDAIRDSRPASTTRTAKDNIRERDREIPF